MGGPVTFAGALLLLVLCAYRTGLADSAIVPSSCCVSYVTKKIPENRVVSYQMSSASVCPKAGVIFTTKKGFKFCGDPKEQWVRKYIKNLDAKKKKAAKSRSRGLKANRSQSPKSLGHMPSTSSSSSRI